MTLLEDVEVPELGWDGHRLLARVSVEDVDEFLAMKGAAGWNRKSVSVAAQALRAFFRYARDARLARCWLRQGHLSTKKESINMRTCPKVPPRKMCDSSCNR
jgi:site-specific recombinase XerD